MRYRKINLSKEDIESILAEDPALLIDAMLTTQTKLVRDVRILKRKERIRSICYLTSIGYALYVLYLFNKKDKKKKYKKVEVTNKDNEGDTYPY